jgi:ABC-2 type transport system ATP-binding protein
MLKISNLKKKFGSFTAVNNISFNVSSGEILSIIGPNGAGKTTTLKMICSLLKPDFGTIEFEGLDYKNDIDIIKKKIGFVPEESAIYEGMNAIEYLRFFCELYDIPSNVIDSKINYLLDSLKLEYKNRPLGNLSKGMKRKVLIARSLINDPEILIYDEPASGLDPITTNFILNYILKLKNKGKTIIFTAHNLHQVEFVCDRIILINKGKIIINDDLKNVKRLFGDSNYSIEYFDNNESKLKSREYSNIDEFNSALLKFNKDKTIKIIDIKRSEKSLQDIFLKIAK